MARYLFCILGVLAWSSWAGADELDAIAGQASAEGLPAAPLQNKIREGQAKKIPQARIRQVVQQMLGHMRRARHWLSRGKQPAPAELITAVAEARMAGMSEEELRALVPPGSGAEQARRVDALVDLHLRGYRGSEARELVRAMSRTELAGLGQAMDRLRLATQMTHAEVTDAVLGEVQNSLGSLSKALKSIKKTTKPGKAPLVPPGKINKQKNK